MAIVTYPLNGIDYNAENAETYLCTRTSGVYSADGNFAASITGDRQVSISKGLAWIRNTDFSGKSVCNTESVAVEIPIADGTRPRIDRIVLRFDKAANASSIVLKQGTPSSAPAAPTVERTELVYELGLCTVLVPAASTIISSGDVTSTLLDESVCGLMRDGVTGIPTEQLQEQAQDLIDDLREVIASIEAGSEVMLKTTYGGSADGVVASADKLATAHKIGNASFDGSSDVTLEAMGLGKVNNTADSDKNVASAGKLRIKTITNLTDASQYANAFCYYSAGVIGSPPTTSDGVLIGLNYGLWGAQIAFPTSGGIYARSGSTTFSAWTRLDQ